MGLLLILLHKTVRNKILCQVNMALNTNQAHVSKW